MFLCFYCYFILKKLEKINKTMFSSDTKTSNFTKKVLFFVFLFMMVGFYKFQPYKTDARVLDGVFETIFYLYFFIINQTLGIVHEAGHGVCYILPCPEFLTVINGTIFQWAFPLGVGIYFLKHGQKSGFYMGLFFLSLSMQYTSWYISTSYKGRYLKANESFLGVDAMHDFNYILDYLGILQYHNEISNIVEFLATILMFISMIWLFLDAFTNTSKSLTKKNI